MAPDIAKYPLRHTTVPDSEPQDKRAVKYKDSIYIYIYGKVSASGRNPKPEKSWLFYNTKKNVFPFLPMHQVKETTPYFNSKNSYFHAV